MYVCIYLLYAGTSIFRFFITYSHCLFLFYFLFFIRCALRLCLQGSNSVFTGGRSSKQSVELQPNEVSQAEDTMYVYVAEVLLLHFFMSLYLHFYIYVYMLLFVFTMVSCCTVFILQLLQRKKFFLYIHMCLFLALFSRLFALFCFFALLLQYIEIALELQRRHTQSCNFCFSFIYLFLMRDKWFTLKLHLICFLYNDSVVLFLFAFWLQMFT